jgi:hypothetical protein
MITSRSKFVRTIVLTVMALGLTASLFGQFPIKIPKIPKINIEKPQTPDTSPASGATIPSESTTGSSSSDSEDRGKSIPGAKLVFSTAPFNSGGAAIKTNFRSSDFIYARLDLGGRTVYDAFEMKKMAARDFYYLYISLNISKDRIVWPNHWINYTAILLVTKEDANKTYLDLDIAPDPSKLTPNSFCGTNDSTQFCGPSGGILYGYRTRDVDSASHTFPSDGTYYFDIRVWLEGFDGWGKQLRGWDNDPAVGGAFTYQFSMQDGQSLVANSKKAEASAKNVERAKNMLHAMPTWWGKFPTPPDAKLAPARLVPMIKGYIGQWNLTYLNHSIYSYSGPLWAIEKDEFNLPRLRRVIPAIYILYKDPKDNACKMGYLEMRQDYAGAGTYGEAYLRGISDVQDIDCAAVR